LPPSACASVVRPASMYFLALSLQDQRIQNQRDSPAKRFQELRNGDPEETNAEAVRQRRLLNGSTLGYGMSLYTTFQIVFA
jgi:hypothetical protein